jgi:hypothetical protein
MHGRLGLGDTLQAGTRPPWPAEWSRRPLQRRLVVAAIISALIAVLGGVSAPASFAQGELADGVFLAVACIYLGHLAGFCVWALRMRRRGVVRSVPVPFLGSIERGVEFRYARTGYYLFGSVMLITVVCSASLLAALAVRSLRSELSGSELFFMLIFGFMTLAGPWFVVEMVRQWRARSRVVLSRRGLHHRRVTFEHFLPWDAVYGVSTEQAGGDPLIVVKAQHVAGMSVHRFRPVGSEEELRVLPFMLVRARWLAVDPALLYHAMRYYFLHPEHRAELGTDAALDRIRRGAVVAPAD